jgi:hypothetical protein
MVTRALVVLALVACQGNREAKPGGGSVEPPRDAPIAVEPDATLVAREDAPKHDEPEPADPGKLIAELGAIPAWQAVIDRAQLLARRDQHGVVYGKIGPAVMIPAPPVPAGSGSGSAAPTAGTAPAMVASSYVWLIDDTEGNGSLGIRVALGPKQAQVTIGDRVALGGAWHLDEGKRWFWKVDSLQALPPGPTTDLKEPPPAEPNHVIVNGNLTPGARTITVARDNDATYFQIVGPPPANDGDGWPVADELGDKVYALLVLPGERASYGGQDMRAADERWQLKKANTYVVRIGRIRNRGPDKPVVMHARTAPIRVN